MKKLVKLKVIAYLLATLMVGCGSSDDKTELNSESLELDLYLYSATLDHYLKISESGDVQYLKCSINDGYTQVEEIYGTYLDNKLTLNYFGEESISTLLEASEGGYKKYTDSSIDSYEIVESVPMYCENDAVEITSFYPKNTTAGVEAEFLVNIDYRLVSKESAIIYPKFESVALNKFSFNYDKIDITAGTRTASFSAVMTPLNGADIESFISLRMMGLVEGSSSVYYEMAEDSLNIDIAAPENPIISESIIGIWTTECMKLYDRLDESYSRKYTYEILNDEITWSYDLYSDHDCVDYLKTNTLTDQYVGKGMVEAIEGIQVHLLERRFVRGSYIGEPREDFFFAYNNVLFGLSRDEQTGDIEAAFIEPYFLQD